MAAITKQVHIACPPDQVFAVLARVERLPELSTLTTEVRGGPGRPVQPGDRFEQVVKVLGVSLDTEWEVVEVVEGQRVRVEGRSTANGRATVTDTVRAEGSGSAVTFEVDYDPPLGALGDLVDKLLVERRAEEEAEEILQRLKALCEAAPA